MVKTINQRRMSFLFIVLVGCAFLSACCSHKSKLVLPDEFRSEISEITFNKQKKELKKVYRNDVPILYIMRDKKNNETTRCYFVNDGGMYSEIDKNGDGFFEEMVIHGEKVDEFEIFRRNKNGEIYPIPTAELQAEKDRIRKASEENFEKIKDSAELIEKLYKEIVPTKPEAVGVQGIY